MNAVAEQLVTVVREHGLALLIGTSALLLVFAILVRTTRSLAKKNALASTAMLACAGYFVVAAVPLPRFAGGLSFGGENAAQPTVTTPTTTPANSAPASNAPASNAPASNAPASNTSPRLEAATPALRVDTLRDDHLFAAAPAGTQSKGSAQPSSATREHAPQVAAAPDTLLAAELQPTSAATLASEPSNLVADDSFATWLMWLTLTGTGLCCLHLFAGWLRLRRILHNSRTAPPEVVELVALPSRTRVRIAQHAVQPFCCGLLRPTIVLPKRLANTSPETRFVLLHERAHLQSGDTRARLIAALLRPLLFWHPLYWWLQHQLRFTSELLADDAAAKGSVADYVRCMMTLSTHPDPAAGGALVATIFRRKSELFRRLEMMLQRSETITRSHSPRSRWMRAVSTVALIALCASAFGVQPAAAQSAGSQSPSGSAMRKQVAELKVELKRLQHEIAAMREAEAAATRRHPDRITFGQLNMTTGEVEPVVDAATPLNHANPQPKRSAFGSASGGRSARHPGTTTYVVRAGDTLSKIAKRFYGTAKRTDLIRKLNPEIEPKRLRVGERIKILGANRSNGNTQAPASLPASPLGLADAHSPPRSAARPPGLGIGSRPRRVAQGGGAGGASSVSGSRTARPGRAPKRKTSGAWTLPGTGGANSTQGVPGGLRPTASNPFVAAGAATEAPAAGGGARGNWAPRARALPPTGQPRAGTPAAAPRAANTQATDSIGGLAQIVTRCIELAGEVEIEKINLQYAETKRERAIGEVKLRSKKQQHKAIRSMLLGELKQAEAELERTQMLQKKGFVRSQAVEASRSKVVLLASALK